MSWRTIKLGDFLKVRQDRFKPKDEAIQSLKRVDKIDFSGNIYLSNKNSNTDMILVKQGDLLISGINVEKGAVAVYDGQEDVTATIHYSSYEFDGEKIDVEFLKLFLKSPEFLNAIKEQVPGGIKTEIKPKHLLPLEIVIPELHEQKEVVEKFSSFHSKQNSTSTELNHQLALVKELRQAYLREAMQGKLARQDSTDEPAKILLEKIKEEKEKLAAEKRIKRDKPLQSINAEEIPFEIPSNWTWCRLGDCSINRDGERVPISLPERERRKKIYDYYGASGVIDKIDNFTHDGRFLLIGEDGANLVARSTPIAFIAEGKFWVNNHAHVIETVSKITTDYLCNYINGISLQPYITGGFQPKLSQGNLNIIVTPLPPLAEQERIVAKLEKLMKFCDELEANIRQGITNANQLLQTALKEALEPK